MKLGIKRAKLCVSIVFLSIAIGCSPMVSLRGYRNHRLGSAIDSVKQMNSSEYSYASSIGWKEKTYTLDNGNWVYIDPYAPNCFIHWEVNPGGTIVGSHLEGKGCDMWPFR